MDKILWKNDLMMVSYRTIIQNQASCNPSKINSLNTCKTLPLKEFL